MRQTQKARRAVSHRAFSGRGLNCRVRNGNGCDTSPTTTGEKRLRLEIRVGFCLGNRVRYTVTEAPLTT